MAIDFRIIRDAARRIFTAAVLMGIGTAVWMAMGARVSAASGDWDGAQKAVVDAYKKCQTKVDLLEYNLNYKTEYDQLKNMMSEVVNETPYLFYTATRFSVSRNTATNQIVRITLGYAQEYQKPDGSVRKSKIKKTRDKLDDAIGEAVSGVMPTMSAVEKMMVLHDYIVSNTAYTDDSEKPSRVTEVGTFLEHEANCEGYSRAFAILMEKVGIPVKFISSDEMKHMWNAVKVGKDWYHVDVTWDDPVDQERGEDQYGLVSHANFLCSAQKMRKNGHKNFSTASAASTKYDKRYWRNVDCSFYYREGKWLYLTKSGITEREKLVGGSQNVLYNIAGKNLIRSDEDQYYLIAYNNIYLYKYMFNDAKAVWKTAAEYSDTCVLDQIKFSGGKIYYRVTEDGKRHSGKLTPEEDGTI